VTNPIIQGGERTLMGLRLVVVEPGTKITNERTGREETVGDDGAVKAGNTMYCTKAVYVRLVQEFQTYTR
jgi:hypothetical protein